MIEALDKAGHLLWTLDPDLLDCVRMSLVCSLTATGRLNSEMVVKALRARVPILASHGAATTNAIHLAENHGLTLAGFARGGRVNLYTFPERIKDE